ncbi:integrase core domain protein [Arenibacter sp. NBRC 103722]|uniref:IS3 family transposase n=1 Tax=Arenibacter sp. NBRC 103722 TaxID=1113929 RepID=UPI0008533CC0|nr:IS3 family transposase [Arenibacter sp. NBRC 103722]GBF20077.1 integrase core domain protein [Arenibacter sp. NBRC 103722]
MSTTERRQKVVKSHPRLSLVQQCKILSIHRSGLYYKPKSESPLNLRLMKAIDAQFLEHPYYGVERMTDYLSLDLGYHVNVKRIRRLYKIMGLQTIYRKPKTTIRDPQSYKFPYLLKDLEIERSNQVWQTDITYIPMFRGFMYMNAVIDVYSRKILNWSISNSMDKQWCMELLEDTIAQYGAPEIHNSDQGVQYTSTQYIDVLKKHSIQISMDGKGRALDNVYIERFWKSIKYEKIYLNPPNGGLDLYKMVREYIEFYNTKRRHTEIGKVPPDQIYNIKKIAS